MKRLVEIVRSFPDRRLVVIGDAIADQFLYGNISRVSREAPVFILRHEQTQTVPGGAANCAMNLASLGARVSLVAVVGDDESGSELRTKLEAAGVDVSGVTVSDKIQTTTKVRILAGQSHSNRQQVIRIDYEANPLVDNAPRDAILKNLKTALPAADAIVISDYNYGVVDARAISSIRESNSKRVLVDSRFRLSDFTGFTAATPNEDEVEHLIGSPITSTDELEVAAQTLKSQLGHQALLVTRGAKGMMLLEDHSEPLHIPAVGAQQSVDVTGAGDTVIATFALAVASDASFADAARLANYAGGLVVMKRGTASVTATELEQSILSSEHD
ncbi:MAG TPA: bifunctional ADP-heptose synthase [Pyrinomonadaceae bacterium]|nr:bifunctional ADP-heptose synthase [Pyrinomonadaceae bacterium]